MRINVNINYLFKNIIKIIVILIVFIMLILLIKSFFYDLKETTFKEILNNFSELSYWQHNYNLVLTNFNIDNQTISGTLSLKRDFPSLFNDKKPYYSRLTYKDLFKHGNTFIFENSIIPILPLSPEGKNFEQKLPKEINVEFRSIGNPAFYPFDKYLIAGQVKSESYIYEDGNKKFRKDERFSLKNLINGFYTKKLSTNEIKNLFPKINKNVLNHLNKNQDIFIISAYRYFFIREITLIFCVLTFVSTILISYFSTLKTISINAIGFIVGVWSVRNFILGDNSFQFLYLDYFLSLCYVLLISIFGIKLIFNIGNTLPPHNKRRRDNCTLISKKRSVNFLSKKRKNTT